jgi:hypothetical protein
LNLEFTVDHPAADKIAAKRSASAHEDLRRWLAGDRSANNEWRAEHKSNAPHSLEFRFSEISPRPLFSHRSADSAGTRIVAAP